MEVMYYYFGAVALKKSAEGCENKELAVTLQEQKGDCGLRVKKSESRVDSHGVRNSSLTG